MKNVEEILVKDFPHKDDWYLKLVLAKYEGQYVTWEKNIDREIPTYSYGHYFDDLKSAKEDFYTRYNRLLQ